MPQDVFRYFRFRSARPNHTGLHVGIFGLVNVLGRGGMLTEAEDQLRLEHNAWYDAAYVDPSTTAPEVYGTPGASAWFKSASAEHLRDRVQVYLRILDAHNVGWEYVESDDPGVVLYEDPVQVVVRPHDG